MGGFPLHIHPAPARRGEFDLTKRYAASFAFKASLVLQTPAQGLQAERAAMSNRFRHCRSLASFYHAAGAPARVPLPNSAPLFLSFFIRYAHLCPAAAEPALNIDFSVHLLYDNKSFRTSFVLILAAVAELADARDLKSLGGNIVPVRSRSAAPKVQSARAWLHPWAFSFFVRTFCFLPLGGD